MSTVTERFALAEGLKKKGPRGDFFSARSTQILAVHRPSMDAGKGSATPMEQQLQQARQLLVKAKSNVSTVDISAVLRTRQVLAQFSEKEVHLAGQQAPRIAASSHTHPLAPSHHPQMRLELCLVSPSGSPVGAGA